MNAPLAFAAIWFGGWIFGVTIGKAIALIIAERQRLRRPTA